MKSKVLVIFISLLMLSGCSYFSKLNPFSSDEVSEAPGKVKMEAGVNPYLWQASLAKLNFMPLDTADMKSGVIVTDWTSLEAGEDESFKITVHIMSKNLRTDALEVVTFKRVWEGGKWRNVEPDARLSYEIEKSILSEARRLYRRDLAVKN